MTAPTFLMNDRSQSVDSIIATDGTVLYKIAVGQKAITGITGSAAWQGVATHADEDEFVAGDGVVVQAGVDRTGTDTARPVLVDSEGRLYVVPVPSTGDLTDASDDITLGGTSQEVLAVNLARRYLLVQNLDSGEDLWMNFGGDATADTPGSILIPAGGAFVMEGSYVSPETVELVAATTAHKFTVKEA